jgi:large subunit ribosomal protein L21
MYAVIAFSGHQRLVKENQEIVVDSLEQQDGEVFDIHDVLLTFTDDGAPLSVGTPTVSGAKVTVRVVSHQQ